MLASAADRPLTGQPFAVGEPCRSVGKSVQASQAMWWSYKLNHFQSQVAVVVCQQRQMTSSASTTGALISV